MKKLKVSVCMATYNGEKYIYKQLKSILLQSLPVDEIIIVDDASTDCTVQIIQNIHDSRIRLYKNDKNKGFLKSFERGILCTTGDIIFFSDQDDIWLTTKVFTIVSYFIDNKVDIVCHDAYIINSAKKIIYKSFTEIRNINVSPYKNFISNTFSGCCMAFRAEIKNVILPIPKEAKYHDRWITIICGLEKYNLVFLNKRLIFYVRHNNNASPFKRQSTIKIIKDRSLLLIAIVRRIFKLSLMKYYL